MNRWTKNRAYRSPHNVHPRSLRDSRLVQGSMGSEEPRQQPPSRKAENNEVSYARKRVCASVLASSRDAEQAQSGQQQLDDGERGALTPSHHVESSSGQPSGRVQFEYSSAHSIQRLIWGRHSFPNSPE